MTHEEPWQLAQTVCTRMTQMYPGDVIIGGVYGSTARAVGYLVIEEVALMETLTTPMLKWPLSHYTPRGFDP